MATTTFTTVQTLPSAAGAINTNPASTITQISSIVLHNTNSSVETVQLFYVPNASGALGTSATTNRTHNFGLAANETLEISFKFPLTLANANDALFGSTTTASKVTATVSGVKIA